MANILMFICLIGCTRLVAKDHGVHGQTFLIEEEDLIGYLQGKLKAMSSEEAATLQESVRTHYTNKLAQPDPVKGLKRTENYSVAYFDPTVVAKADITDNEGRVIVRKGDTYNPLQHTKLPQNLLIFDGEDSKHIAWAESREGKWIWVNGQPLTSEKREERPIYFDQFGLLCKKLNIQTIPAQVSQEGERLKIESFPISEAFCKKC